MKWKDLIKNENFGGTVEKMPINQSRRDMNAV